METSVLTYDVSVGSGETGETGCPNFGREKMVEGWDEMR